jgi:hypothetical protein
MAPRARTPGSSLSLPEEVAIDKCREYGVGVDCHQKFIQVCVLTFGHKDAMLRAEGTFLTTVRDLFRGREWTLRRLRKMAATACVDATTLRYNIESTGCYHFPVLHACGRVPSVVNRVLPGQTRPKTDVLDARSVPSRSL